MKKVLYIINELLPGGAQFGLELLINSNAFSKFDFYLVCISNSYSELDLNINNKLANNIIYLSNEPTNSKKIYSYLLKFYQVCNDIKPDLIVASLSQAIIISRFYCFFNKKTKHVCFEHNSNINSRLVLSLLKISDPISSYFLVDSEASKKFLLNRNNIDHSYISYVPLFSIDYNPESIKDVYLDKQKIFRIVSIGRLSSQKAHHRSLSILAKLRKRKVPAFLDIYGDGDLKDKLVNISKELGVFNYVSFKGFKRNWKSLVTDCDAYLISSDYEGLSISTLEAMSIGLPVVARNIGEISSYLNRENGFLYSEEDEAVSALETIYNDSNIARNIGYSSFEYIKRNFSYDTVLIQIKSAINHIEKL